MNSNIGDRIKIIRKRENLTQEEFAKKLKSAQNTITGYETGRRTPSSQMVELICREFSINENWLTTGSGEMKQVLDRNDELAIWSAKLIKQGVESSFTKQFVYMLSKLDTNDWKTLEKMARLMAYNDNING